MKRKLKTEGDIVLVEINPLNVHLCSEADLRASIAAIHRIESRYGDASNLPCRMEVILEECERCIPSLKGLRP